MLFIQTESKLISKLLQLKENCYLCIDAFSNWCFMTILDILPMTRERGTSHGSGVVGKDVVIQFS